MEWMYICNVIIVFKFVIDYFFVINFMVDKFLEQFKIIIECEVVFKNVFEFVMGYCVDFFVIVQIVYFELQKRKLKWIFVQVFRLGVVSGYSFVIIRLILIICIQKGDLILMFGFCGFVVEFKLVGFCVY